MQTAEAPVGLFKLHVPACQAVGRCYSLLGSHFSRNRPSLVHSKTREQFDSDSSSVRGPSDEYFFLQPFQFNNGIWSESASLAQVSRWFDYLLYSRLISIERFVCFCKILPPKPIQAVTISAAKSSPCHPNTAPSPAGTGNALVQCGYVNSQSLFFFLYFGVDK